MFCFVAETEARLGAPLDNGQPVAKGEHSSCSERRVLTHRETRHSPRCRCLRPLQLEDLKRSKANEKHRRLALQRVAQRLLWPVQRDVQEVITQNLGQLGCPSRRPTSRHIESPAQGTKGSTEHVSHLSLFMCSVRSCATCRAPRAM